MNKKWLVLEKSRCWTLFIKTELPLDPYGPMVRITGRSLDSCTSMIWKVFHRGTDPGGPYWCRKDFSVVRCLENRETLPWTKREDEVMLEAHGEQLPPVRIAELVGRLPGSVEARILKLRSAGRPTLTSLIE